MSDAKMETEGGCFAIDPYAAHGHGGLFPYHVKDGESIKSIADALGITWEELAILNWGTCVPHEVNWYLEHYVGCRKNKAGYYYFEDSNNPGILYLPNPLPGSSAGQCRAVLRVSRYPID